MVKLKSEFPGLKSYFLPKIGHGGAIGIFVKGLRVNINSKYDQLEF